MRPFCLALCVLLLLGCDDDGGDPDAGVDPLLDAGDEDGGERPMDAGADAGGPSDAGPGDDAGAPLPSGPWRVYVTVGGENRLAVLEMGTDGSLSERADLSLALPARPGALAWDGASRLYVGLAGGMSGFGTIALSGSGAPSLEGRTTGTANPVYLAAAPGGRLVSAFFGADEARVHDVSGAPPHAQLDVLATAEEPHAIRQGPDGRFYVPHRTGGTTWWLDLAGDGTLSRSGEEMSEMGDGPRHIAFHPSGDFVYVVNEFTDSVGTYSRGSDGALALLDTETTLPSGADGSMNTCADIHITPNGQTIFASNRGHDSIARLRVESDGTLTFLETTSTEARPREFELTADGTVLLALGQDSGFAQSYSVAADGALTMVTRLDVGDDLRWAIAIEE